MTTDDFVKGVKLQASDAGAETTISHLRNPPGRRPTEDYRLRSQWFLGLSEEDRTRVEEVVRLTAENAIFGFLCILDGARFIEDSEEKGEFVLTYERGSERNRINRPDDDLHDIFKALTG